MAAVLELGQLAGLENTFEIAAQPRLRVVVADDSADYLEVVCAMLELEDEIDVVGRANNGVEAVQATARLEPDLLLMDVQMPLMNGLAAASVVFVGFPLTSTVLMSAEDSPQLRAACLASGARAFIHKPHFRQDLAGVLRNLFEDHSASESPFRTQPSELECD